MKLSLNTMRKKPYFRNPRKFKIMDHLGKNLSGNRHASDLDKQPIVM